MWRELSSNYAAKTSPSVKAIDFYLLTSVLIGLSMMAYCFLFAPVPYNSFLAALFNSVGSFVLAASIRMQLANVTKDQTNGSRQSIKFGPFCEFIAGHVILNVFVARYI